MGNLASKGFSSAAANEKEDTKTGRNSSGGEFINGQQQQQQAGTRRYSLSTSTRSLSRSLTESLLPSPSSNQKTKETMSHLTRAMIPQGLSSEQRHVYQVLLSISHARAGQEPPHLIVITDLAKDYDDLAAMVVLKELHRLNLIHLEGFIANLVPAKKRAQFGRGALNSLGLSNIPIAEGLSASQESRSELPYEFNCPFMAPEASITETGSSLLHRLCTAAKTEHRKLTLLCISPLEDIADFASTHGPLLRSVLHNVILQGGYTFDPSTSHLTPDPAAANNYVDLPSATAFHAFLQKHNIPSTVYTKDAAFATPLTPALFATLAETTHPVGRHLRYVQVEQDVAFYARACLPEPERFAPFYDREYFLRNRTAWFATHDRRDLEAGRAPTGRDIVPYLTEVVIYDALAAVGAAGWDVLHALRLVRGLGREGTTPIHKVVAGPGEASGVEGERMATALGALLVGGLREAGGQGGGE